VFAWFDREPYVLPEQRVVHTQVMRTGRYLDGEGVAKRELRFRSVIQLDDDLPLAAVRSVRATEGDEGTEIVEIELERIGSSRNRGTPAMARRSAMGPSVSGGSTPVYQV
jgi:hypothetical protein